MKRVECVVAAAVLLRRIPDPAKDGQLVDLTVSLPPPARHPNIIHTVYNFTGVPIGPHEQGFLTSEGRFVGRKEAWMLAVAARQVKPAHGQQTSVPDLFSEDLW